MTVKDLKEVLNNFSDDDAIIVTRMGKREEMYKIFGVDDTTNVGVVEIKFTDFQTDNFWEK